MINHHKLPSCGAVSTFCLYYQHLQYAIHEIKNLKDRTTLPGKFSVYSKGSRANLKQYLSIYQYSVPSSQKLRGHIHIEVATQNVNLTLYFLTTYPPPMTSRVAIEKYLPNKPLNLTDEIHRPCQPISIKNYWDFAVSNHGSCFRWAEPYSPDFSGFLVLEFFQNQKELFETKCFYSEILKSSCKYFFNYPRHFWS